MKYFYSYYPTKNNSDEEILFNLLSIKLSSTLLHKKNKKIGIYSDTRTIELLKEYGIELDFYENIENEIKNISSNKLFAVCKIYSNMIQTEPFVQLDTDLFLFDNFNYKLLESNDVSFFTLEEIDSKSHYQEYNSWVETYLSVYDSLSKKFPNIIHTEYINPLMAYSCALVGGCKYDVFSEIYTPIFDLIKNNKIELENLYKYPMAVLEQHIITGHLNKLGYDLDNINIISYDRIPHISYNKNKLIFTINKTDEIILSESGEPISLEQKKLLMKLFRNKFNGSFHLQGGKHNIDIMQLIYSMLNYYDTSYVSWLENKIGKKYEFQQISFEKNTLELI